MTSHIHCWPCGNGAELLSGGVCSFFLHARLSSLSLSLFVFLLSLSNMVFTLTQPNKHKLFSDAASARNGRILAPALLLPVRACACVRVCVCVFVRTVDRWCRTAGPEWQVCVTLASPVVKERKTTLTERNYLKRNISAGLRLPRAGKQRGLGGWDKVRRGGPLSEDMVNRFGARKKRRRRWVVIKDELKLCLSANLFFLLALGFLSNGNKCFSSTFLSSPLVLPLFISLPLCFLTQPLAPVWKQRAGVGSDTVNFCSFVSAPQSGGWLMNPSFPQTGPSRRLTRGSFSHGVQVRGLGGGNTFCL